MLVCVTFAIYKRLRRFLLSITLLVGAATTGAAGSPQADVEVDLRAREALLITTSIHYDVSITNNGPQPLTSATVTLQLDSYAAGILGPPCTFNAGNDTASCSFGALAVGATATMTAWIYYSGMPDGPIPLVATASRSVSVPADPVSDNDSASATCFYLRQDGPILNPPPQMFC